MLDFSRIKNPRVQLAIIVALATFGMRACWKISQHKRQIRELEAIGSASSAAPRQRVDVTEDGRLIVHLPDGGTRVQTTEEVLNEVESFLKEAGVKR